MEAERARERPGVEDGGFPVADVPPAAPGEKGSPRLASSLSRCPYCHDEIRAERADWVACEGCLARHHASCWSEHGSCATCQSRGALERRRPHARRSPVVLALLLSAGVASILPILAYVEKMKAQYDTQTLLVDLPVAARDLHAGELVNERDIVVGHFPRAGLEGLGQFLSDVHAIDGMKLVVPEVKRGAVFTQNDFRRPIDSKSASPTDLDRDLEIAKARGNVEHVRRSLREYHRDTDTLHMDRNGDFERYATGLVQATKDLGRLGLADEAARAKRGAEALYADEPVSVVKKLLGVVEYDQGPGPGIPIEPATVGVGDQPDVASEIAIEKARNNETDALRTIELAKSGVVSMADVSAARSRLLDAAAAFEKLGQTEDAKRALAEARGEQSPVSAEATIAALVADARKHEANVKIALAGWQRIPTIQEGAFLQANAKELLTTAEIYDKAGLPKEAARVRRAAELVAGGNWNGGKELLLPEPSPEKK